MKAYLWFEHIPKTTSENRVALK